METVTTDVLVLGAGAAGIRAALAAHKEGAQVCVVSQGQVAESGSSFSNISKGWGIQALIDEERSDDNMEAFYEEIMRVGLDQCDSKVVRILVEESGTRVEDLIYYGIRFRKDLKGDYLRIKGCFSNYTRAFVTEDFVNVKETFRSLIRNIPAEIVSGYIVDLIMVQGTCWGALILSSTGHMIKINARATILATGGGGGVYKDNMVRDEAVGDGYAVAYRAGAELRNMEFIQFMLGLKFNGTKSFLPITELHYPGKMLTQDGRDLLEIYIPDMQCRFKAIDERLKHYPFSCRDSSCLVDLAVGRTREDGNKVYWRESPGAELQPEVVHFAHAFNGGVKVNDKAETSVSGLFAAGEVAAGPHGADRIGGCMMSATQVFGERSGRFAATHARELRRLSFPDINSEIGFSEPRFPKPENNNIMLKETENEIKGAMSKYVSVLKREKGLKKCKETIQDYENQLNEIMPKNSLDLAQYFKVKNMILTCRIIIEQALTRKQSKGSHYLEDIPPN